MFTRESDLVKKIIDRLHSHNTAFNMFNKNTLKVSREVKLGYGIPDIVLVGARNKQIKARNYKLTGFDIGVLSIIKKEGKIDVKNLIRITKSSKTKIINSLEVLTKEKIVKRRKGDYFTYRNYEMLLSSSIAIETKLKDRKRAIKQAYRYKWFANKSFVFLPAENTGPAEKNIKMFRTLNVGLASVNHEGDIHIMYDPINEEPISQKMQILLSEQQLSS